MLTKTSIFIVCIFSFAFPVFAQHTQVKLKSDGAPSLRIVSTTVDLEREQRRVTLRVEVENMGDKPLRAFSWMYRTQDKIRDYNVSINIDMPEVSLLVAPKERKTIVLLADAQVPEYILNMPAGEIRIVSVTFDDGSSWKRKDG